MTATTLAFTSPTASNPATSPASCAPDYIRKLPPYMGTRLPAPVARAAGVTHLRKMASNENPLGASPKALAAAQAALAESALYPDAFATGLRSALSECFNTPAEGLVIGNGSSELIDLAARCFLRSGDEAVYAQYSFIGYPLAVKSVGATSVVVPARAFGHDLDAMLAAITPRTRLVFIANPNNPTGTLLPERDIVHFLEQVPPEVLVILDEAYTEYLPPEHRMNAFALLPRFANLVVMRTFSKAYGLAGLRVGFAAAHADVAELLNRTRLVFNVSMPAQAAALAALDDADFLARTYRGNREGMAMLTTALRTLGLPFIESWGNFVAVDFSSASGGAAAVNSHLQAQGFFLRPLAPYGLPGHLRITIGLPEDNAALIDTLRALLR